MTKWKWLLVSSIILICIFSSLFFFEYKHSKDNNNWIVETYQVENGWGYQIMKGGKTYIYQPYMPCVEGEQPFAREEIAKKTGELVIWKLIQRQTPGITKKELENITGKSL